MARFAWCALLVVSAWGAAAADEPATPADGLYRPAKEGPAVPGPDGQPLHLGARWTPTIRGAWVVSRSNANDAYDVQLRCAHDAQVADAGLVLVVGGRGYAAAGAGRSGTELLYWHFAVPGREPACAVAAFLGVTPFDRRHPGHRLRVAFEPVGTWTTDGPREVELVLENVGETRVAFLQGGMNRGWRDNQFTFVARKNGLEPVPDTGNPLHEGGRAGRRILEPGQAHRQRVDLRKWFDLGVGTYEILGAYAMTFLDPDAEEIGHALWTGYVAEQFLATVVQAK